MKCLLFYNNCSGRGDFEKEIPELKEILISKNHEIDVMFPETLEDLREESLKNASLYDCFLVAGGDGTLNNVINGVMRSVKRPKILLIPRGTANDVAGIFGISKNLEKNLRLLDEKTIKTDIGQINDKYFTYAVSCGAFSDISYNIERKNVRKYGYLAYLKQAIRRIGSNKKIHVKVEHDLGEAEGDFCLGILLNSKRVAGFTLRLYSEAKMNDGILELRLIRSFGFFNLMRIAFFFLLLGRKNKKDKHIISTKFYVEIPENICWNIDGERGPQGSVDISVHKEAVEFFVNEKRKKKYFDL